MGDETSTHPQLHDEGTPSRLSMLVIGKAGVSMHELPESGRVTLGRSTQCDIQQFANIGLLIDNQNTLRGHLLPTLVMMN